MTCISAAQLIAKTARVTYLLSASLAYRLKRVTDRPTDGNAISTTERLLCNAR